MLGGALIGGLALGTVFYFGSKGEASVVNTGSPLLDVPTRGAVRGGITIAGALLGVAAGAVVGALAAPERWRAVYHTPQGESVP